MILADDHNISETVKRAQIRMLDLAQRHHGLTRKVLHLETGIPLSTLQTYEEGTAMPVSALVKLARVIPNELTSLLFDPGGKGICDADPDENDLDELARAAVRLLERYVAARHPSSPGGIRIVHSEADGLKHAAAGVRDKSAKVAAG